MMPGDKQSSAHRLCTTFSPSIGDGRRKAYRLGKWLADVNAMRKMPLTTRFAYLELLASGGSAVYYFVEQLTW